MVAVVEGVAVSEAARRLLLSPDRVRGLCREGRLAFTATPYGRLIDVSSLEALRREREAVARE